MDLYMLGWSAFFQESFQAIAAEGYVPARISAQFRDLFYVYSEQSSYKAKVSGKLRFESSSGELYPAVGDWTAISYVDEKNALIHSVLPRKTKFSRKIAGKTTEEQIIAANIDTVFVVSSLNNDFNLRRLERYLTLVWESGASPVIILSKADLCDDVEHKLSEVETTAFGVPIHIISTLSGTGLNQLSHYCKTGKTIALVGSSGVGKSTLINTLLGYEVLQTAEIREDDHKGRHTTTHRELVPLPQGGLIIDTPGMRELQLWGTEEGLADTFENIEALAQKCFFKDCRHESEPRCAVKQALSTGELDRQRYENYLKMKKELAFLSDKKDYLEAKDQLERKYALIRKQIKQK